MTLIILDGTRTGNILDSHDPQLRPNRIDQDDHYSQWPVSRASASSFLLVFEASSSSVRRELVSRHERDIFVKGIQS